MNCLHRHLLTASLVSYLLLSLTACTDQSEPSNVNTPAHDKNNQQQPIETPATQDNSVLVPSPVDEKNANNELTASKQLVLDMGFSEAQNKEANDHSTANFCLGNKSDDSANDKFSPDFICTKISNRLASVSMESCLAAKLKKSGCQSVKGFPIVTRSFLPIEGKIPQGRILVLGGTHADELTSISTTFKWIEKLNKYHSGLFHWHVAPLMNPDGLFRKGATRTNNNGVDLNRNMPTDDWHTNALLYWQTKGDKNPRKYPGKNPSSEPETQWLIDEINNFKPDAIISVHAPYGIVDFDSLLLKSAPKSLGKLHLNLLGTYPGSLGNYAGINRNIPVITVELAHAWEMPPEKEVGRIWEDIVTWLKRNINTTDQAKTDQQQN